MDIITTTTQDYIHIFSQYLNQFLSWGQWLFFSLLTINLVIACVWYAFDSESFQGSASKFIRNFFIIGIFYTIMVNHVWLTQILASVLFMGKDLTGMENLDPSSVIENGFAIANNLIHPVMSFNIFKISAAVIIMFACYFIVIACFISIALNLAVTLIMCQILISLSTFFLGFSALESTRQIARNVLDTLLAYCVKLLGLYLVVGAGSTVISEIETSIPGMMAKGNFDAYWWLASSVLLFWLLAKNIPDQMARLVTNVISETRGHESAAIALAAFEYSKMSATAASNIIDAGGKAGGVAAVAAGTVGNSWLSHFNDAKAQGMGDSAAGKAVTGVMGDLAKSTLGSVADRFRHLGDKAMGGNGIAPKASDIPGVVSRMNDMAKSRSSSSTASNKSDS